jgi:hypothetical protein
MKTALIIYGLGAASVALRRGWHMYSRLDKFDWAHGHVWQSFFSSVILWPLRILFIVPLLEPEQSLRWGGWSARRHRDTENFRRSSPRCGALIRYRPKEQESCGDFILKSPDLETECRQIKNETPHFFFGIMENDLLSWLHQRDATFADATELPAILSENVDLSFTVQRLVLSARAKVWCPRCGDVIPPRQISNKPDAPRPGSNYERLYCPRNHQLLAHRTKFIEPLPPGLRHRKA